MIDLLHMDCLDYMKECEDNAFDLVLTDPPYGVGFQYNSHDDKSDGYYNWCDKWFMEVCRISATQVLTVGYKNNAFWYAKKPKHAICWIKENQCSPSPLGGFNCYELVFLFGKTPRIGQDIINMPIKQQPKASFHPCPKEVNFWTHLLNKFPASSVFDPFMGSGTGAVSCHRLNIDFVGCEIDKDYFDAACQRYDDETRQLDLLA